MALRNVAEIADTAEALDHAIGLPADRSYHHQVMMFTQADGKRLERVQQYVQVLARLHRADKEHERPVQLIELAGGIHRLRRTLEEPIRDAGMNHRDLLRR